MIAAALLHDVVEDTDTKLDEIQAEFGRAPSLASLFDHPTVTGLVASLGDNADEGGRHITLRSAGSGAPLFFVHGKPELLVRYLAAGRPVILPHGAFNLGVTGMAN